ncbi:MULTISPECIES: HisA/HisF-related TIM barrel protein [unclassified Ketobacter]|uniref:HisA/HisF-related TIM barrel protein n=1 Tax=unclassified Ketobacter TaxID=2639109 RepID=UPI000F100C28|nr:MULTISPECIES: HisA/HisF-related TIM barrel protein [unclassified Ketobacter]RLT87603.1 MAG: imidazole glycerol phosphate synthase subunit HisF [Ketobacter sp. GenoA1]RLT92932.1 MAG: imidazole glycerol phosphate synthase subunit HisF [Ketobacter sp.]
MMEKRNQHIHPRVIVFLLLDGSGAINTIKFKYDQYIGDPINLVRIFNHKEADEMVITSKTASKVGIDFKVLGDIAASARFPLSYCGGVSSLEDASRIIQLGYEKVSLNSTYSPQLTTRIAKEFGTSCVSVSIDVKKSLIGSYRRFQHTTEKTQTLNIKEFAIEAESAGAGELIINMVDKDGTYSGYDIDFVRDLTDHIGIPIVICGGARNLVDMKKASDAGCSAFGASSMFVFFGAERGVLPTYPSFDELQQALR